MKNTKGVILFTLLGILACIGFNTLIEHQMMEVENTAKIINVFLWLIYILCIWSMHNRRN